MPLTPKQTAVLEYAHKNGGQITKQEAMGLIDTHYSNGAFHVGNVLSRMVKARLLIRLNPGVFKVGTGKKSKPATTMTGQTSLDL